MKRRYRVAITAAAAGSMLCGAGLAAASTTHTPLVHVPSGTSSGSTDPRLEQLEKAAAANVHDLDSLLKLIAAAKAELAAEEQAGQSGATPTVDPPSWHAAQPSPESNSSSTHADEPSESDPPKSRDEVSPSASQSTPAPVTHTTTGASPSGGDDGEDDDSHHSATSTAPVSSHTRTGG